jgi:hypothetical protein
MQPRVEEIEMLTVALIALMAQQGGAPPASPPPVLRVVVAAPIYQPNGSVSGEIATLPGLSPSVLYIFSRKSLCDSATTSDSEPRDAGFGWKVAAHVANATAAELTVSVDWRRMWDRGKAIADGPAGHAQLTLHSGDRIPLDHIPNASPSDACRAVGMGLEVRLGRAPAPPTGGMPIGAREGGSGQLDVDLWLVHTPPGGREQAQHQRVRLNSSGGPFTFPAVKFTTQQGEVGFDLNGSFQRYTTPGGEYLLVAMSRLVTGASTPAGGLAGNTSSFFALPRPDEVPSFDLTSGGGGGVAGRQRGGGGGGGVGGRGAFGSAGGGGARGGAAGSRGTGGGVGARQPAEVAKVLENLSNALQVTAILDGHRFALRMRVTPVPGS